MGRNEEQRMCEESVLFFSIVVLPYIQLWTVSLPCFILFVPDLHSTQFPKENLKMYVGLKLHLLALHTGLEPTFVTYVLKDSNSDIFRQLELFSSLTSLLCPLPHIILQPYPSRESGSELWLGSGKHAGSPGGDFPNSALIATAFPWTAYGFIWTEHPGLAMARSAQEWNLAGSGECWGIIGDTRGGVWVGVREAGRGIVMLASCSQALERPSSPLVPSACCHMQKGLEGATCRRCHMPRDC